MILREADPASCFFLFILAFRECPLNDAIDYPGAKDVN
jgi:hypothetical protein